MAFAKSSVFRAAVLAALLLALSLPLKFAVPLQRVPSDDMYLRPMLLLPFLEAQRVPVEGPYEVTSYLSGWTVRLPHCEAHLVPQWQTDEITDITRDQVGPGEDLHFVYRGRVTESLPYGRAMLRRMLYVLNPVMPSIEYRPFIVMIIAPKNCADYRALPWAQLDASS